MSDIVDLFGTPLALSIVVGEKQTERSCDRCKNPFVMDVDFYICNTDNNQPVCMLCATDIHRPFVDLLTMWSIREERPLDANESLNFNEQAIHTAKASLERCMHTGMVDHFYELLLEEPLVKHIFESRQHDLKSTKKKLIATLVFLLANAAQPDTLRARLESVATMHSRSQANVHPLLYQHFLRCMVASIAQFDPQYGEEVKKAWLHILPIPIRYLVKHY